MCGCRVRSSDPGMHPVHHVRWIMRSVKAIVLISHGAATCCGGTKTQYEQKTCGAETLDGGFGEHCTVHMVDSLKVSGIDQEPSHGRG